MMTSNSRLRAALVAAILLIFPILHLRDYLTDSGSFLQLIHFGRDFAPNRLPEINELDPPTETPSGYDGQFYSQIAIHPTLSDPELSRALDNPSYRARRIGLPFLAWCVGLGQSAWILHTYAALGFIFWFALWLTLVLRFDLSRPRDALLALAMLCTTGTAASLLRAVPDFPAAVLGVFALWLAASRPSIASLLMAASGLTKETALLAAPALLSRDAFTPQSIMRNALRCTVAIVPLVLWLIYVHARLGDGVPTGSRNFTLPLIGVSSKLFASAREVIEGVPTLPFDNLATAILEFLAPISLMAQAIYFLSRPRPADSTWRFGIGFALLALILGPAVWEEQAASTRILLPMTFAFNLLIHPLESKREYTLWFIAGNVGLIWGLLKLLD